MKTNIKTVHATDVANEKATREIKKDYDFSAFGENADEIRNRVEYIRNLGGFVDANGKKNAVMTEKVVEQYLAHMTKFLEECPGKLLPLTEELVDNQAMSRCLQACLLHSNILLTGPKGTGKMRCVKQLASLMGLEYDCWQMVRTWDSTGLQHYINLALGEILTENSEFIKIAKSPLLLVVDEIDKTPEDLLRPILDGRRLPNNPDVESACINELVIVCGTMNEGCIDTEPLSEAVESCFHKVVFSDGSETAEVV